MKTETYKDDQLSKMLRHDPLANAERVTGNSYKEDPATMALGFLSHLEHGKRTESALLRDDDTTFSNTVDRYTRIIIEEGFEKVLELPFVGKAYAGQPVPNERFQAWFHRADAMLLSFDTHAETHVNGSHLNYNWHPHDRESTPGGVTSTSQIPGHPGYPERSGQAVVIIRPLKDGPEIDQAEVGPMYRIQFSDGVETDCFEDELRIANGTATAIGKDSQ